VNERIQELLIEAHKQSKGGIYSGNLSEWTEKFAELIIRQCGYYADIFEAAGCPVDMDPAETKPSDYIKQHFGVES
jgi:hypothetical protein